MANPFREILSKIFNWKIIEKFKDSNYVFNFLNRNFKLSSFIKGLNIYSKNPLRDIYDILFPETDKIWNNIINLNNFITDSKKSLNNMRNIILKSINKNYKIAINSSLAARKYAGSNLEKKIETSVKIAKFAVKILKML